MAIVTPAFPTLLLRCMPPINTCVLSGTVLILSLALRYWKCASGVSVLLQAFARASHFSYIYV